MVSCPIQESEPFVGLLRAEGTRALGLIGASGAGKTEVTRQVGYWLSEFGIQVIVPKSDTTRPRRENDPNEDRYRHHTRQRFTDMMQDDDFIVPPVMHAGEWYGYSKTSIGEALSHPRSVVVIDFKIDCYSAVRSILGDDPMAYLLVEDPAVLRERIEGRPGGANNMEERLRCAPIENDEARVIALGDQHFHIFRNEHRAAWQTALEIVHTFKLHGQGTM